MDAQPADARSWSIKPALPREVAVERAREIASAWAKATEPPVGDDTGRRVREVALRLQDDFDDVAVYTLVALSAGEPWEYVRAADGKRLTGRRTTSFLTGAPLARLTFSSDPAGEEVLELRSAAGADERFPGLDEARLEGLADFLRLGLAATAEADHAPPEVEPRRAGAGSRAFLDADDYREKLVALVLTLWSTTRRRPTQDDVGVALVDTAWYDYRGQTHGVDGRRIREWNRAHDVSWRDVLAEAERRYRLRRTAGKTPP